MCCLPGEEDLQSLHLWEVRVGRGDDGRGRTCTGVGLQDHCLHCLHCWCGRPASGISFSSFLQFHNHCPFHVSGAVWLGRIPRGFLSSASLLSQPLSLLPWATLKLPALQTQVPFFLIILFLLKARLPYHENHCQTTGPQGPTQHVPSYSGNRSETAHTHAGSGAPAARYNCVFTDLSALLPVLSAGSHVLFVHWPQDEKPCTDG